MRLLLLMFLLIGFVLEVKSQDLNLQSLESRDYHGYYAGFAPNPNEFLQKNVDHYFTKSEISTLKSLDVFSLNAIIHVTEGRIVKLYHGDGLEIEQEFLDKLTEVLLRNISVKPRKYVSTAEQYEYIVKSFSLLAYEY